MASTKWLSRDREAPISDLKEPPQSGRDLKGFPLIIVVFPRRFVGDSVGEENRLVKGDQVHANAPMASTPSTA